MGAYLNGLKEHVICVVFMTFYKMLVMFDGQGNSKQFSVKYTLFGLWFCELPGKEGNWYVSTGHKGIAPLLLQLPV